MKGMIRIIALLTAVLLTAALCGCNDSAKTQTATEAVKGNTIILEPDVDSYQKIDETTLNITKSILETRLLGMDINDFSVSVDADKTQLKVVLPEKDDTPETRGLLTAQGKVTFCSPDGEVLMDGSVITSAVPSVDTNYEQSEDNGKEIPVNGYLILLNFNDEGKEKFAEITEEYMNQEISICMDGEVLASPTVYAPITDGAAQIMGDFTAEDVTRISTLINCSPLSFPLRIVESDSGKKA